MKHTANIINPNKVIFPSLLKAFEIFELSLIDDNYKLDTTDIRCINCKKETGLYLKNKHLKK